MKVAIVILADVDGGEGLGRVVNALTAAREFKDAGDDVNVTFTGAGTKWVGELAKKDHDLHGAYVSLKNNINGACSFCSSAFKATESVKSAGVATLEECGTFMSFRKLVKDGYQVLKF